MNETRITFGVATLLGSTTVSNAQTADGTAANYPDTSDPGMMSGGPAAAGSPSSHGMGETSMGATGKGGTAVGKMISAMRGTTSMMTDRSNGPAPSRS